MARKPRQKETINGVMHLRCCGCLRMLPTTAYHYTVGRDLYSSRCKPCHKAQTNAYQRRIRPLRPVATPSKRDLEAEYLGTLHEVREVAEATGRTFRECMIEACVKWMESKCGT
jgi:hypothetical protein